MKYLFRKIRLKKFPHMMHEWVLVIANGWQLMDYMEKTTETRVHAAMTSGGEVLAGRAHHTNALAFISETRAKCRETSFAHAMASILDEVYENRIKLLERGMVIYIKSSGGYSYDTTGQEMYDILEEKTLDELHFPQEEVRYIKWPNGSHFYAKIGDVDIEWEGKQKWDTQEQAEEAVKFWKRSKGVRGRKWTDQI